MDELSECNVLSIPKLLRAIAGGQDAKDKKHDLIFLAAAKLIEDLVCERDECKHAYPLVTHSH